MTLTNVKTQGESVMACGHGTRFIYCTIDQEQGCAQCNEMESLKHDANLMEAALTRLTYQFVGLPPMDYVKVAELAKLALKSRKGGY